MNVPSTEVMSLNSSSYWATDKDVEAAPRGSAVDHEFKRNYDANLSQTQVYFLVWWFTYLHGTHERLKIPKRFEGI